MSQVTLGGNPIEVAGTFPSAGAKAADFTLVGKDLGNLTLASFGGKRKVLNIVPSLDTPLYHTTIEPYLSDATRTALGKAASSPEWNTFLLSSPDFNYR